MNRNKILIVCYLTGYLLATSCDRPLDQKTNNQIVATERTPPSPAPEDFLARLTTAGVFDAAHEIGLDLDQYLLPVGKDTNHVYRRYRWSVGYHDGGGTMISALPPEEELGWTPWERWYRDKTGKTRKESWVMYPLRNPVDKGVARWYKLAEDDIKPRYLEKPGTLKEQLRIARIYEAASVLGFDADEVLLRPLSSQAMSHYQNFRWVVIPHILGKDGPVIYILPPMNRSDEWPWESWYTDGKVKLIHHVHYTKETSKTKGSWTEYPGAPQRPPEIFGVIWYWYDDATLTPTLADVL